MQYSCFVLIELTALSQTERSFDLNFLMSPRTLWFADMRMGASWHCLLVFLDYGPEWQWHNVKYLQEHFFFKDGVSSVVWVTRLYVSFPGALIHVLQDWLLFVIQRVEQLFPYSRSRQTFTAFGYFLGPGILCIFDISSIWSTECDEDITRSWVGYFDQCKANSCSPSVQDELYFPW